MTYWLSQIVSNLPIKMTPVQHVCSIMETHVACTPIHVKSLLKFISLIPKSTSSLYITDYSIMILEEMVPHKNRVGIAQVLCDTNKKIK